MYKSMIGLVCGTLLAGSAVADESLGILSIYDQFITSSAAASRCIKPAPEELQKFTANLMIVGTQAGQELERRNPGITKEQVTATLNRRTSEISTQVFDMVKKRGCDDKEVQLVVKRFSAQANWQPPK